MGLFDYLPPDGPVPAISAQRGQRVIVPFGKTRRVGVIVHVARESQLPADKLRRAIDVVDQETLLDETVMELLEWAADYYQHPAGEVFSAALPGKLRKGGPVHETRTRWVATPASLGNDIELLGSRAPVQAKILSLVKLSDDGLGREDLAGISGGWRGSVAALEAKGWLERQDENCSAPAAPRSSGGGGPMLTDEQAAAVSAIGAKQNYSAFLLDGVTGSGKTEVYLSCIQSQLEAGRQSLVLVPEIGLTPQLVDRFKARLGTHVAVMHSGLSDTERVRAWAAARDGIAGVIIGTRSAVFVPMRDPGMIVIDEEHDSSLKQQEGFRYSARDLGVWRARQLDIPIVLGSATPSFESLENARAGRYQRLRIHARPGETKQPTIHLIDLRVQPVKDGLTEPLRAAIDRHLRADGQVMLYLNRRGYAPVLICTTCGETQDCHRCDARLVYHHGRRQLICHHCSAIQRVPDRCPECDGELTAVGQGTERLDTALAKLFPQHQTLRIDRDTTRRRGEIGERLEQIRRGEAQIVVGTQMLTKGHDFPRVTLVGIVDADQGLFGTDFRSSERLAQSFIQVAGRAGRGDRAGEVFIQTLFPDHPLLTTLVTDGYHDFAEQALQERRLAGWPPFTRLALLRAESARREQVFALLDEARVLAEKYNAPGIDLLGPAAAPMERRSGRYRGQLLLRADSAARLQRFLTPWRAELETLKSARRARWSLDVDPIELF